MSIVYIPLSFRPSLAAVVASSVTAPSVAPWTPPRSTTSWPLMNTQTSSSPGKSNGQAVPLRPPPAVCVAGEVERRARARLVGERVVQLAGEREVVRVAVDAVVEL